MVVFCMRRAFVFAVVAVVFVTANRMPAAYADTDSVVAATYGDLSVSPPSIDAISICHGFGCKFRDELALTGADRATLARFLAAGAASAAAERRAIAAAGAWFDRRIGPVAGTVGHVARANREYMFDKRQMDCIDSSRNTTSLLLVLAQLKLLRHHTVAEPEARGFLLDGRGPHATAVLVEKATGAKWAVDSWTRAYGQAPEIMPLAQWMTLD
ncbi:MAG: hypothetical protein NTU64_10380 [Hyphomicrobiales bacterium]|nr:hypothetical protein [Hyphomicrobiales bacterium]